MKRQKELSKKAFRKLAEVDGFLDELWGKVDSKKLSGVVSELREAMNTLSEVDKV